MTLGGFCTSRRYRNCTMSKKSSPQSGRNTTTQNDTPPRSLPQTPSTSDDPNSESDSLLQIAQREIHSNPTTTTNDSSSSVTETSRISYDVVSTASSTVISLERRQRLLERQRSLDSLLTEALRISEQALTDMRRRNEQQRETSVTWYLRQTSYTNGSDDDDESNTPESSPRNLN